jgi:hypothetical protein
MDLDDLQFSSASTGRGKPRQRSAVACEIAIGDVSNATLWLGVYRALRVKRQAKDVGLLNAKDMQRRKQGRRIRLRYFEALPAQRQRNLVIWRHYLIPLQLPTMRLLIGRTVILNKCPTMTLKTFTRRCLRLLQA